MKDKIEHDGVISFVESGHVQVKIVQQAACSECKAKSLCSSSESKEKVIDVYEVDALLKRRLGDHVHVCGTLSMGKDAVRLAFGGPLAIMVAWVFVAVGVLGMNELLSVGILFVLLAFYFFIMYCYRDKMSRKFAFWIEN